MGGTKETLNKNKESTFKAFVPWTYLRINKTLSKYPEQPQTEIDFSRRYNVSVVEMDEWETWEKFKTAYITLDDRKAFISLQQVVAAIKNTAETNPASQKLYLQYKAGFREGVDQNINANVKQELTCTELQGIMVRAGAKVAAARIMAKRGKK